MPAEATTSTAPTRTVPAVPRAATQDASAPTVAAAGRVSSQTPTIRAATHQRTGPARRPAADPRTAPEATWVVDRANPRCAELRITAALAVSAAKPCGLSMSL